MGSIHFDSIATAIPPQKIMSSEILNKAADFVSHEVLDMMSNMQIEKRYSVVDNYVSFMTGETERKLITDVNALAVQSIESCLERTKNPLNLGLLITITNTAARPLPCTSYELIAMTNPDLIPRDINSINMQNQGCSALVKAFEVASWYLKTNPGKQVLITVSEAHTAMFPPCFDQHQIHSFHEIRNIKDKDLKQEEMLRLINLINSYLFGDGAVSMLLSYDEQAEDLKSFHLTNISPSDTELLHMDEGGSLIPSHADFPHYLLSKRVPEKGGEYSRKLLNMMMGRTALEGDMDDISACLVHTGSKKIIDEVSKLLHVRDDYEKISTSYYVLKNYGNLSSCSIGFMLEHAINHKKLSGRILLVSFGVGFSGSIAKLNI